MKRSHHLASVVTIAALASAVLSAACGGGAAPTPTASKPAATSAPQGAAPSPAGAASPSPAAASSPLAAAKPTPATVTKVKMGQTGTSPASWPLYAAQDRGFFREQGLEIESIVLSSSVTQTQALITGDMNFNTYSVDSVAKPVLAGASLKMIGSAQEVPNFQMIVASDVRSFADLRGKTVAAGSAGGYFDIVMRGMLSANGLKPTDYEVISIGSSADRLPALQAGRIQGMIAGGPDDSKALAAGLKSLGYVNEYLKDLQYNGYAVEQGWARANEPTVIAFLKAMINATNWLVEPANKADAIRIYRDVSKLDDAFLETIYQQMVVQKMLSRDLRINLKGTQNVLDLAVQQGSLEKVPPLDTWIDMSYLDKAQRA